MKMEIEDMHCVSLVKGYCAHNGRLILPRNEHKVASMGTTYMMSFVSSTCIVFRRVEGLRSRRQNEVFIAQSQRCVYIGRRSGQ